MSLSPCFHECAWLLCLPVCQTLSLLLLVLFLLWSGHTVQFCRDQHGSRFIQQKLEVSSEEDKEAFFEEILPHTQRCASVSRVYAISLPL